ncbi:MAG: type VI secretion system-associated protein TagF [Gammaproteobacteria bacterium]|nr:type VI secretion system-associated protein TagF [Gammaproteobacteria bacterium]
MTHGNAVSLYGKLPGYGDFLKRNLSSDFAQLWDEWLQFYISVSKEQTGDDWLDIYLTSPIWRFVLSSGVIDDNGWGGLVLPSVDRVGRYFPFSILMSLTGGTSAVNFLLSQQQWFHDLESLSLLALDEEIDVDDLIERVEQLELDLDSQYLPTSHYGETGGFITELATDDESALSNSVSYMLDASLSSSLTSFSLWQTTGSSLIAPSIFCSRGLPPAGNLTAMIDGQWQSRNWKIPFNLNV